MQEADAREVIRWEAEQHVPFDMDNVELDFQILDPDGEGLQMTVLLVAAKRELVDHKLRVAGRCRASQPSIIDVDAFALHNAFEINYPDAMNGVVGLVNIGHENTNMNILDDGVPVLTRDIPVGTRRFREDLQRERGQSAEEAERLLQGGRRRDPRGVSRRAGPRRSRSASSAPPHSSSRPAGRPAASRGSSSPAAARGFRGSAGRWATGSRFRSSWPIRSRSFRWPRASSTPCRWTK